MSSVNWALILMHLPTLPIFERPSSAIIFRESSAIVSLIIILTGHSSSRYNSQGGHVEARSNMDYISKFWVHVPIINRVSFWLEEQGYVEGLELVYLPMWRLYWDAKITNSANVCDDHQSSGLIQRWHRQWWCLIGIAKCTEAGKWRLLWCHSTETNKWVALTVTLWCSCRRR